MIALTAAEGTICRVDRRFFNNLSGAVAKQKFCGSPLSMESRMHPAFQK
jgi:hypothetical protein